ncbi:CadD family cadmium resistance transporter [Salirhabdus sp. Marseille-P4669]|uniref:CadD family cadmium resistance transporter n=1 Tax=Salirhabdus sp. Marseille-P4669 TaxID=2042310 RepID=UPI000C7BD6AE|nr:CadD family cadmium resistance transporter [Salirhabdus sp. Marseille-P4669]
MFFSMITAIVTFLATSIDELFVLTILFTQAKDKYSINQIYIGQILGMLILLVLTTFTVFGIQVISMKWIGLLGFIPIFIGLRMWIVGEDDDDEDEVIEKAYRYNSLLLSVAFIAIAGGAEELAIYIPYFSTLTSFEYIVVFLLFLIFVPIWCTICRKLSRIKAMEDTLEKYERVLAPIVFIGLGIYVLMENHTWRAISSIL